MLAISRRIDELPTRAIAAQAWDDYGEVIVCASDQEAVREADRLAAEHVEVHTSHPDWYLENLTNYGSLFLGDHTTVPYGDKGIGTNHVLPTAGAARYTGGLWVGKFLKTLTYQRIDADDGVRAIAPHVVEISRADLMPAHEATAAKRLERVQRPA